MGLNRVHLPHLLRFQFAYYYLPMILVCRLAVKGIYALSEMRKSLLDHMFFAVINEINRLDFCSFAGHDEQRFHLEALVMWAQTIRIIEFLHVYEFLFAGHDLDGHVIVASVFKHNQTSVNAGQD